MNEGDNKQEEKRRLFISSYITATIFISLIIFAIVTCENVICKVFSEPYIFYLMVVSGVICILFPFIKQIRIGNFLLLEREIKETRRELSDFKTDIKQRLTLIQSSINTNISSSNSQAIINIAGSDDAQESLKEIEEKHSRISRGSQTIKRQLTQEYKEDFSKFLLQTRVELEYLLRIILGKTTDARENSRKKFLSLYSLVKMFINKYPEYKELKPSFDYVRNICNLAAHAQRVAPSQAEEVLNISSKLIAILRNIADNEGFSY